MRILNTRMVLMAVLLSVGIAGLQSTSTTEKVKTSVPNFIIISVDDMGYGDLGSFGHPTIRTPNLDKMVYQGQKWTNFYTAASVCTPSRAGLLTGRLPVRSGMCSDKRRVLFPDSKGGLPSSEITIATLLNEQGYHTAAIGKWHLGNKSPFLPSDHGFENFFGIYVANDNDKIEAIDDVTLAEKERFQAYNIALMRDGKIVERPLDQRTSTRRFTEEAIAQIHMFKDKPFFIYLSHFAPHVPLFRSEEFKGISKAGIYGDVVEEIDWSVGQILETLSTEGIAENTFVIFTSDNGPWSEYRFDFKTHAGSSGLLRGAKGGTFEGGLRVPTIFWWPGKLKPEVVMDMATQMDILPTFCSLAKVDLPNDRIYDGYDISPVLFGTGSDPRDIVFYYRGTRVAAIRKGDFKAHFFTQPEFGPNWTIYNPPLLYNLSVDPSEKYNIAKEHPAVIAEIKKILEEHLSTLVPVENQLEK